MISSTNHFKLKISNFGDIILEVAIRWVGSGSGSGSGSGRVSLTFWKKSIRLGRINLHVIFFQIVDRFRLNLRPFNLHVIFRLTFL
jgi:hypothetical protein